MSSNMRVNVTHFQRRAFTLMSLRKRFLMVA